MSPRRAEPEDATEIARLFRRSRAARLPWLPVLHTPEEDAAFFARALAETEVWVIGELLDGFVAFRPGWIDHLYVHPTRFGQGVGAALLALVLQGGAERQLWCFQRNTPARRFYERHGFAPVRETLGDNEEGEPDVLYRRSGFNSPES